MATATKRATKKPMTEAEKTARRDALKNESKAAKFVRLGVIRVPKALQALKNVERLADYDYTPEQAAKVLDAIGASAQRIHASFTGTKPSAEKFSL